MTSAPDTWTSPAGETHACENAAPDEKPAVPVLWGQPPAHDLVQWSPLWGVWLCAECRQKRSEAELRAQPECKIIPRVGLPPESRLLL